MQFPTLVFAVFFAAVLSLAWLCRRSIVLRNLLLLVASYVFYAAWNWRLSAILALSSLISYFGGELIARAGGQGARRAWLWLAVAANLGLLVYFKYAGFFLDSLRDLADTLGLSLELPVLQIALPLGISFFTFTAIGYLIDVARGSSPKARSLLSFLLFIAYFPKLSSGPICRARELLPQLEAPAPAGVPDLNQAAALILSGLFKKVVLASLIDAHAVSAVFETPENYSAAGLWAAVLGFGMLLYWDFSGYTDLARGLSLLLGIRLPENFNLPYIARDIGDFWRRWHMTFSFWLRDYVFMPLASRLSDKLRPLGYRRASLWGSQAAVLITFALCGLWHGAGWTFVLWGLWHGAMLFAHHGLRALKLRWSGGGLGIAGTFLLVNLGWVLFRARDLATAWAFLIRMFSPLAEGTGVEVLALVLIVAGLALHAQELRLKDVFTHLGGRMPLALRVAMWFVLGMGIVALKPGLVAPYIYFGF